jgi:ABC-2 type transport system permease protein
LLTTAEPSAWRAWVFLIRTSWQRQARAQLMVWIAIGLLAFTALWVGLITARGVWDIRNWRQPRRGGMTLEEWVFYTRFAPASVLGQKLPQNLPDPQVPVQPRKSDIWTALYRQWKPPKEDGTPGSPPPPFTLASDPIQLAVAGAYAAVLDNADFRHGIAVVTFSRVIVFSIIATFLVPLCSLSFATEALGREREQRNLLWTLTRPLPRPAVYLGKFVAVLPWCLALNLGGLCAICLAAGAAGWTALELYWPAVAMGTITFTALYHLMGALFRRPAVIAILYSFFLESVMGNLPGQLKRASISFYMRCLMFDSASVYSLGPDRPLLYEPVNATVAWAVLAGLTVVLLAIGARVFARTEYLDLG